MANVKTTFFIYLIFAKVRSVLTKVTDTHTDTDKPMAISEIVQISLKQNFKNIYFRYLKKTRLLICIVSTYDVVSHASILFISNFQGKKV